MVKKFDIGDIVQLKKTHPCGEDKWEVMRIGVDFRIKCLGCDRQVWVPRLKFNKRIKKIVEKKEE